MITFVDLFPKIRQRLAEETQAKMLRDTKKYWDNPWKPREQPTADSVLIEHVIAKGDVKTYCLGAKEPIRGYADAQTVILTATYKKLFTFIAEDFKRRSWLGKIITLLYWKRSAKIWSQWFGYIFSIQPCLLKEEYWSQPIKELRRVLKGKIDDNLVDMISLTLEFDAAYRYRLQDILGELNKKEDIGKEIDRLFNIYLKREEMGITGKMKIFKMILKIALWLPKVRKMVEKIVKDLKISEVKLSKEDIYWTNQICTYNYRGMTTQQRRSENVIKYGGNII
jgi:hypothetical protein